MKRVTLPGRSAVARFKRAVDVAFSRLLLNLRMGHSSEHRLQKARIQSLEPRTLLASITGNAFNDLDADGVRGPAEWGVANVSLVIKDDAGATVATVTTDNDGRYLIQNVTPDAYYSATITVPSGLELTTSGWAGLYVGGDNDVVGPDFGLSANFSASGTVSVDVNGDQMFSPGDGSFGNIIVYDDLNQNATLDSGEPSTTASDYGQFVLRNIQNDGNTHTLCVSAPAGWSSGPAYSMAPGGDVTNVSIFVSPLALGTISGMVFYDQNGDGVNDYMGLSGIPVSAVASNGWSFATTTDYLGQYTLYGLSPRNYTVSIQVPELNWQPTTPTQLTFGVTASELSVGPVDFGLALIPSPPPPPNSPPPPQYGSISGAIYRDHNLNGTRDGDENGLAGVPVFADELDSSQSDYGSQFFAVTDALGNYTFSGVLVGGSYQVSVVLADYQPSTGSSVSYVYNISSDQPNVSGINQGWVGGEIDGSARNPFGVVVPGAMVWLDQNQDGAYDSGDFYTYADANGAFRFVDLDVHQTYYVIASADGYLSTEQIPAQFPNGTFEIDVDPILLGGEMPTLTGVTAAPTADGNTLWWSTSIDLPGVTVEIYRSTDPTTLFDPLNRLTSNVSGTTWTDTTASPGVNYYYGVRIVGTPAGTPGTTANDGTPVNTGDPGSPDGSTPPTPSSGGVQPNDDLSANAPAQIGFHLNFYGKEYDKVYVNNNGNVTFGGPLGTYTPFDLTQATSPIIAPFFGDVDTRKDQGPTGDTGSGNVTYHGETVNGRKAFAVYWNDTGYFNYHSDKRNTFSLKLVDRSEDTKVDGDFDIVFTYGQLQWETGDASGGSHGMGGSPARAGYSNGSPGDITSCELYGSGESNGLIQTVAFSTHTFPIRNLDLQVDSSNTRDFNDPSAARTVEEDRDEAEPNRPGKIILVNDGDLDGDGVLDYLDGYNFDQSATPNDDDFQPTADQGAHFVPLFIQIPEAVDLSKAKISLSYLSSPPSSTTSTNTLRIWKRDQSSKRNAADVANGGDFVNDGAYGDHDYTPAQLGVDGRTIKLWVEAVKATNVPSDGLISVTIDPDGPGPAGPTFKDRVLVRPVKVDLDVNNNGTLTDPLDGATNYLPGYGPSASDPSKAVPVLSTGTTYKTSTFVGQQMRLIADGLGSSAGIDSVQFSIEDVTNYAGYSEDTADPSLAGAATDEDFSFEKLVNARSVAGTLDSGKASAPLWAKDYGAWARIRVVATVDGHPFTVREFTLPSDVDQTGTTIGDKIADRYERAEIKKWNEQYGTRPGGMPNPTSDLGFFEPQQDRELRDPDGYTDQLGFVEPTPALRGQGASADLNKHASEGDGRTVLQEYRGYILDGGGHDWDGQNAHGGGHIRLSPVYKELLVEVDAMANMASLPDNQKNATVKSWMNLVSIGTSQRANGAGFRLLYAIDDTNTAAQDFQSTAALETYNSGQHTIVSFTHLQLVKQFTWDSYGQTTPASGASIAADGLEIALAKPNGWHGFHPELSVLTSSYISHELHHTYAWNLGNAAPAGGHLADTNGNGISNEAEDFSNVLYDYQQNVVGYDSDDYLHIKYGKGTTQFIKIR